jgi:hypothetical protein
VYDYEFSDKGYVIFLSESGRDYRIILLENQSHFRIYHK